MRARVGAIWDFQGVKHDLWDWDFPAPPMLLPGPLTRNGQPVEAVAQVTNNGHTFVLDCRTGVSLFPIEGCPVPPSTVDGEFASPTQPRPLKPTPFARQGLTEDMLTTRTPEAHAAVLARFRAMKSGMFQPPSLEGTIVFPGFDGGAEWGGVAFDAASGLLFVTLERDAVGRETHPEQRHLALQLEVRHLPSRGFPPADLPRHRS